MALIFFLLCLFFSVVALYFVFQLSPFLPHTPTSLRAGLIWLCLCCSMFTLVLIVLGYYAGSLLINYVFSLKLSGFVSLVSYNFECGFVSSLSTHIRFKLNYWLIIINFIIFELEVLLSVIYIFFLVSYFAYFLFLSLLLLLFFDLYY